MRALLVAAPGNVEVTDIAAPIPADDEVLVAPLISGLCGTDLELIDGSIDPLYARYPLVLGHEWAGELLGDVEGIAKAGDHVVVEGIIACGTCFECQSHNSNRCTIYDEIGFTRAGGIAERIAVPARLVHRLETDVDTEDALLIEPMAVVWRALTRIPLSAGRSVAVVGDGTVALLAAHLVQLFDPSSTTMIGCRPAQERLAREAGASTFLTDTPGERFDLVIEAAGTGPAACSALSLVARGGIVVLLGLPAHGTTIQIAPGDLVNNDIILHGSFSYTRDAWADVVRHVNARQLTPSFLITHRFGLEKATDAIATLDGSRDRDSPRGKVAIILPNSSS